ncbi:HPr-rel-A system PqqD family peptide chaperone [Thiohalobacter sp. IOR34]|uniref:HPr-rel-A system PqqD family peptide chaperone n=1 Tax=Thiohalobacter sp. IOR34 TaxID=3057176 RepID=UPI0025B209B7|nr:HPr-rel-A system PqqD family peptide chaperone [Thiohalobacter sp. IOR34]WJW74429.1 HPr-rel-A system PqqD family peptide chaperone [Thiohalobacter sp. IOR34]
MRIFHDGDEWVCYHELAGDTHLFELIPGTLLQMLREETLSGGQLVQRLRERFEFEADFNLAEYVDEVLWKFEQNALIRPVP